MNEVYKVTRKGIVFPGEIQCLTIIETRLNNVMQHVYNDFFLNKRRSWKIEKTGTTENDEHYGVISREYKETE